MHVKLTSHCFGSLTRFTYSCRENFGIFDLNLNQWKVYAGEYNISVDDVNEKTYHIRRVIIHPGYNATSLENDIALIILADGIMYDVKCVKNNNNHHQNHHHHHNNKQQLKTFMEKSCL